MRDQLVWRKKGTRKSGKSKSNEVRRLTLKDFSFMKGRKISSDFKGCLSDAVIEERNAVFKTIFNLLNCKKLLILY